VALIICCGLAGELSLSVTPPFRVPVVVGLKVTLIEELWPALSVLGAIGQLFV
jgi:hypothetical protein